MAVPKSPSSLSDRNLHLGRRTRSSCVVVPFLLFQLLLPPSTAQQQQSNSNSNSHPHANLPSESLNYYEPRFSISREPGFGFPITEGMTLTMKCEIDGNPWSPPSWIKDKTTNTNISISEMESPPLRTDEEGSFTIISAKAADSGWYRCVTDNPIFGHVASFGYYLNVRTELPVTLEKVAEKLPLSPLSSEANSISLGQNGEIPSHPHPQLVPSSSSSREDDVGFPPAGPSDASFNVNSTNNLYHDLKSRYAVLQSFYEEKQRAFCGDKHGVPLIVSINRSVNAIVGRPISLTAEFCCDPSPRKVFWIHRHLAMAPGRIIGPYVTKNLHPAENSRSCYTSTFDIDSVKPEDGGIISFIVTNSNGLDDVELSLNVTRAGFSVSRGNSLWNMSPSSSLWTVCLGLLQSYLSTSFILSLGVMNGQSHRILDVT